MRFVEDHHVDRLGVEAWQHVKLTSTNRSIGLLNSTYINQRITHAHSIQLSESLIELLD